MSSIIKRPVFVILIGLALFVYLSNLAGLELPEPVSFYFNDLLCMPIVLSICLAIARQIKKDNMLYVPIGVIVLLTLYYAFHFEWLLPKFYERYTADLIDVGLYSIGAGLFFCFQKRLF